jgi:hypothetical protein
VHGGANIDSSASYSTTQLKAAFCARVVTRRLTTLDPLLPKAEMGDPHRGQVVAAARAHGRRVRVRSSYGPRSVEFEVGDTLKVTLNTGPLPLFLSRFLSSPLSHLVQLSLLLSAVGVRRASMVMVCRRPSAQRHQIWGRRMTTGALGLAA